MSRLLTTNCRAKIIRCNKLTDNLDKTVTLVKFICPYSETFYEGQYWRGGKRGAWIVRGGNLVRMNEKGEIVRDVLTLVDPEHLDFVDFPREDRIVIS